MHEVLNVQRTTKKKSEKKNEMEICGTQKDAHTHTLTHRNANREMNHLYEGKTKVVRQCLALVWYGAMRLSNRVLNNEC